LLRQCRIRLALSLACFAAAVRLAALVPQLALTESHVRRGTSAAAQRCSLLALSLACVAAPVPQPAGAESSVSRSAAVPQLARAESRLLCYFILFDYAHPGIIHGSIVIVAFLALRFPCTTVPVPHVLRFAVLLRMRRSRFTLSFTGVAPTVHCLFVIFFAAFLAGGSV